MDKCAHMLYSLIEVTTDASKTNYWFIDSIKKKLLRITIFIIGVILTISIKVFFNLSYIIIGIMVSVYYTLTGDIFGTWMGIKY
jgi:hypothetical protein